MPRHFEVVNAALVALVAIVGMIFYFNTGGGAVGAFHESRGVMPTAEDPRFYQLGAEQAGPACIAELSEKDSSNQWAMCCTQKCTQACQSLGYSSNPRLYYLSANPFEDCGKSCINGCQFHNVRTISKGFNVRGERTTPTQ